MAIKKKYKYDYPEGLDLDPESPLHKKLLTKVMDYAKKSRTKMEEKFSIWDKLEDNLAVYVPKDVNEEKIEYRDKREPTSIIIPITWATLETLLTYQVSTFLESPVFKYKGVEPDDTVGAAMLEMLVETQVGRFKMGLNLYTMWRDSLIYGFAPVLVTWDEIRGKVTKVQQESVFSRALNSLVPSSKEKSITTDEVIFEGNRLYNIKPRNYLPDPQVPVNEIQDGRFVGWVERTSYTSLVSEERFDDNMFNVKYLKGAQSALSTLLTQEDERYNLSAGSDEFMKDEVDTVNMYVDLIPEDWDLGESEYPEKWFFMIAGDQFICKAQPLGLDHDMYPIAVECPTFDGSLLPTSEMEVIYGLQHTIDWFITSRIRNVRRVVNGITIIDPYVINENDLRTRGPEKIVRLRRPAFGRSMLKDAVMPLPVVDSTSGHMSDITFLINIVEQVSGATDILKGMRRESSERVSATEAEGVMSSALSRLAKRAKIGGMQAHFDLAYLLAAHTKQLMTKETQLKTFGRYQEILMAEYGIEPPATVDIESIDINYDVVPHDGALPGAESTRAWIQLFQVLSSQPEIAQQFDLFRIFQHIARGLGARNVADFQVKVAGPERIQQEVDNGNVERAPTLEELEGGTFEPAT